MNRNYASKVGYCSHLSLRHESVYLFDKNLKLLSIKLTSAASLSDELILSDFLVAAEHFFKKLMFTQRRLFHDR